MASSNSQPHEVASAADTDDLAQLETSDFFNAHRKGVRKHIRNVDSFEAWKKSQSRTILSEFAHALADCLHPASSTVAKSGKAASTTSEASAPTQPPVPSSRVESLLSLLAEHSALVDATPPLPQQTRFGNPAFRDWHAKICRSISEYLGKHNAAVDPAKRTELSAYYSTSFGDHTRLDYGTGHEVSFVTFIYAMEQTGALVAAEDRTAVATRVFPQYFNLVRKLIVAYRLEPAGSHGVWSLDDYQCLPFLFGAAQLLTAPSTLRPRAALFQPLDDTQPVGDNDHSKWTDGNMFFEAVAFVRTVKRGAGFDETSPMLYQIMMHLDWTPLFAGLVRVWHGEVLDKFPVAQHFLFGDIFPASWVPKDQHNAEDAGEAAAPNIFERLRMERAAAGGLGGNLLHRYFYLQPTNASDLPNSVDNQARIRAEMGREKYRALTQANAHLEPNGNGIEISGWSIRSSEGPLATTAAIDEITTAAEGVPAPEMIFDKNFVELHFNKTGVTFRFDVIGGLLGCTLRAHKRTPNASPTSEQAGNASEASGDTKSDEQFPFYSVIHPPDVVEHKLAEAWRERSERLTASGKHIAYPVFNHDWTYSSVYQGSIFHGRDQQNQLKPQPTQDRIDYELLKQKEPILWYKSVTLYESELDDAGVGHLSVKIRVMPSCFFLLLRLFMRVDHVSLRIYDTRYFHRFGSDKVLIETKTSDASFEQLGAQGHSTSARDYHEPHKFEHLLEQRQHLTEEIHL